MRTEAPARAASAFEALRGAARTLAHADAPQLTAEALLAHVLGLTRTQLLARLDHRLAPSMASHYAQLVTRAARGEPLAYLTGRREFCGLDFYVDARALVPRPETELLIDQALRLLPHVRGLRLLDVGTGSGCLAVTLAVKYPEAHVVATDVSSAALALARRNAEQHRVSGRITFVQADLLAAFSRGALPGFDLLCANLPYIPSAELRRLPVSQHEPMRALDGGADGLALIGRLLRGASRVMAPHGRLLLEIGAGQSRAVTHLARTAFPRVRVEVLPDLAGIERVIAVLL